MDEVKNINSNTKGEVPPGNKVTVRVTEILNSTAVLDNFKKAIAAFLENQKVEDEDSRWLKILPKTIVSCLQQLEDKDYVNDEILEDIDSSIYSLQKRKDWRWYSSKELENGFEIIVEGDFQPRFANFIHCQNVPLANISIKDDGVEKSYRLRTFKDYTTYKTLKV